MAESVGFQDIMGLARQESARLHHYFIGVEHLFIALTRLNGGLTNAVLEKHGLSGRFLRYSILETIGRYEDRRFWPGFPETPRARQVLQLAQDHAGDDDVSERALLLAILDEGDSVVIRALHETGGDPQVLRQVAANWDAPLHAKVPDVPIRGDVVLDRERERVLQVMFRDYSEVEVVRELDGGYSSAQVLLVRPRRIDRKWDAPVVVKLDDRAATLYERRRYDLHVAGTLPVGAAQLLGAPVVPDDSHFGGLRYKFVGHLDATQPISLREVALEQHTQRMNQLIRALYQTFGPAWWEQRTPFQFGVWREYEHVLPPALVVEVLPGAQVGSTGHVLTPLGQWSRGNLVLPGEVVALKRFAVQKLDVEDDVLHLAAGAQPEAINRSSKVEVRGLGLRRDSFLRGEILDVLVGRVVSTRDDLLLLYLQALEPEFDLRLDYIPSRHDGVPDLPNPLRAVNHLLERQVAGYLSTIHGDMHLANVLVGPQGNPWLIDFAQARDGHTLFDWALLEVSVLAHVVARLMPDGWEGIWGVIALLDSINRGEDRVLHERHRVARALTGVKTIRDVVQTCLYHPTHWNEYYIALVLLALRAMGWRTESTQARRLAFLTSALALSAVQRPDSTQDSTGRTWSDSRTDAATSGGNGSPDGLYGPRT